MTDRNLQLLKQADPVTADQATNADAEREQLSAILATDRLPSTDAVPRKRGMRLKRLTGLAAAGALATAGLVAVLLEGGEKASPGAVRALDAVAAVASAEASQAGTRGYAYHRLSAETLVITPTGPGPGVGYTYRDRTTIEQWAAADGSGRVRETPMDQRFVGPRDKRLWREDGSPRLPKGKVTDRRYAAGTLDNTTPGAENLPPTRDLPSEPGELAKAIRKAADASDQVPTSPKMFEIATAVLMQAGTSPQLRASLYKVVAEIDGVRLKGNVRDPRGRPGTAVSIDYDYSGSRTRATLTFDAKTSQVLAATSVLLEPQPYIDGREVGSVIVEETAQVSSVTARP